MTNHEHHDSHDQAGAPPVRDSERPTGDVGATPEDWWRQMRASLYRLSAHTLRCDGCGARLEARTWAELRYEATRQRWGRIGDRTYCARCYEERGGWYRGQPPAPGEAAEDEAAH